MPGESHQGTLVATNPGGRAAGLGPLSPATTPGAGTGQIGQQDKNPRDGSMTGQKGGTKGWANGKAVVLSKKVAWPAGLTCVPGASLSQPSGAGGQAAAPPSHRYHSLGWGHGRPGGVGWWQTVAGASLPVQAALPAAHLAYCLSTCPSCHPSPSPCCPQPCNPVSGQHLGWENEHVLPHDSSWGPLPSTASGAHVFLMRASPYTHTTPTHPALHIIGQNR